MPAEPRPAVSAKAVLCAAALFVATFVVLALGAAWYLRHHATGLLSRAAADMAPSSRGEPDVLVRQIPSGRRIVSDAEVLIRNHYTSGRDVVLRTNAPRFPGRSRRHAQGRPLQVVLDFVEDTPQRRLATIAGDLGFALLDMLPVYRRHRHRDLFFDHCHPRSWANDLMGRTIAGWMQGAMDAGGTRVRAPN